jgi:hypothetical protein
MSSRIIIGIHKPIVYKCGRKIESKFILQDRTNWFYKYASDVVFDHYYKIGDLKTFNLEFEEAETFFKKFNVSINKNHFVFIKKAFIQHKKNIVDAKPKKKRKSKTDKSKTTKKKTLPSEIPYRTFVNNYTLEKYSDKSFIIKGETFTIKDILKQEKAKWNKKIGWVLPISKYDKIKDILENLN